VVFITRMYGDAWSTEHKTLPNIGNCLPIDTA